MRDDTPLRNRPDPRAKVVTRTPITDLAGVAAELIPDLAHAEIEIIGSSEQRARRTYVRTLFAVIEGLDHCLFMLSQRNDALSKETRERAQKAAQMAGRKLRIDHNEPSRFARGPVTSFASFCGAHGCATPVSVLDPSWETYPKAIEIRNRVTHPQSHDDCMISDEDLTAIQAAHHWYHRMSQELLRRAMASAEAAR